MLARRLLAAGSAVPAGHRGPCLACALRLVSLPGTLTTCVFIYQQHTLNCVFMAQCTFHS